MPLPLAPVATFALRYSIVALTTWAIARSVAKAPRDQRAEDALDDLPEGFAARRDESDAAASARLRRSIRLGHNGPGVEIDFTALGRLRIKRLKRL